jgi:hypothetical protein
LLESKYQGQKRGQHGKGNEGKKCGKNVQDEISCYHSGIFFDIIKNYAQALHYADLCF